MLNQDKDHIKQNQDRKFLDEAKNHSLKKVLETQDKEVTNHQILEVEQFLWVLIIIEIILLILNKKEKKLALKSALSIKVNENKIVIIDTFEIKSFKTKELNMDLKNFDYKSALFIYSENGLDNNFKLASSNIPKYQR